MTTTPLVLQLRDTQATNPALTGGKGSRLASLTHEGFPVPDAIVVTADAYQLFVDQLRDAPDWSSMRCRLEDLPLPQAVEDAIAVYLQDLAGDSFAVRSSSTLEDLADSAFAGQHETYLNVSSLSAIAEHVRYCFLSLWNERALSYRSQRGFDHRKARMAVVIQRLIPCEVAGVAFSLDPVSGDSSRVVIEANYGLGESVVGGETAVDHWEIDRGSREVSQATIATKTEKTIAVTGGVELTQADAAESSLPCLDSRQLREVCGLVLGVAEAARFPQDIEWGIAEGKLWLLQARAITTLTPRWTRQESAERFPNPMTPLTWEFVEEAFHESLDWSLRFMNLPPCRGRWFAKFDGYIYGNQNLVEMYCGQLPFRLHSLADLDTLVPKLREEFHWVGQLPVDWNRDLDDYLLKVGAAAALDPVAMDDRALWQHIQDLVGCGARYFLPNIAISITHGLLCRLLHQLVALVTPPDQAPGLFQALLAWGNTRTSQINRELQELAALVRETPELQRLMEDIPSLEFHATRQADAFPEFAARFGKFIRDHGHRETDFDMYHAPWGDAPEVVLEHVRGLLRTPAGGGDTERAARLAAHEAELRLLALAPVEWRFFFAEVLRLARVYTQLDDLEHYQTTRLNLPLRRSLGELGRRFQDRGLLGEPYDMFFAQRKQIDGLLEATAAERAALAAEIAAQKSAYQAACARDPGFTPDEEIDECFMANGETLKGLPGSPGTAEGVVYHVRGPEDFATFPTGAVLVSRTTNPAWTPLFHLASAVVTESGGPLSHGAVTARELGIPAVMSVARCLTLLPQGTRVRIDGLRGLVIPLDESPAEAMDGAPGRKNFRSCQPPVLQYSTTS